LLRLCGLPFNAVFGPGAPEGIVLLELLTQEAVLTAFNQASTKFALH
jgi:suppressor for copper-sensitivity B